MEVTMEDGAATEAAEPLFHAKAQKSGYDALHWRRKSAKDIVAKMLSVKKDGQPKAELRQLVMQMFLNFITLRQANCSILLEEDQAKAETEHAKALVDFTTLQLMSLMYEKNHYMKAIK